jgi:hypothetical protein
MPAFEVVAVNQCFGNRRARKTRQALRLQTPELIFNPAGYHNNVMQNITLSA